MTQQPQKKYFDTKLRTNPGATGLAETSNGIVAEILEPAEQAQPATPKIGRPRKPGKVKKTFHITDGNTVINKIRLILAQKAEFVVKDESVVAEVAFKLLADMVSNPEQFDTILERFKRETNNK